MKDYIKEIRLNVVEVHSRIKNKAFFEKGSLSILKEGVDLIQEYREKPLEDECLYRRDNNLNIAPRLYDLYRIIDDAKNDIEEIISKVKVIDSDLLSYLFIYFMECETLVISIEQYYPNIKKSQPHIESKEEPNDKEICLPPQLNTRKAKVILQKAIEAGLCDSNYEWKKTIQLLAYFADKMSSYLVLTNKMNENGRTQTSWKPFEVLFKYNGKEQGNDKLKSAKQNWMKNNIKFTPTGHEEVDILFEQPTD